MKLFLGLLTLAGSIAFSFGGLVLGIRLLLLARRTRQLPERLLGWSFLIGGFLASLLGWVIYTPMKPPEPYLTALLYTLRVAVGTSCTLLVVMAWKVFRPNEAWAKILAVLLGLSYLSYVTLSPIGRLTNEELVRSPLFWWHSVAVTAPYFWHTWEAARYQILLRRRWAIGLPVDLNVATRMQFWTLAMGAEALMFISVQIIRVYNAATHQAISPALLVAMLGVFCTSAFWMAFFTPKAILKRAEREAAANAA
jgi:hypothetical protein